MRKAEKRSPLKAPPVRLPGQSVAEVIERLRATALGDDLVLVAIAFTLTMMAGLQWWLRAPLHVMFFVSLAYLVGSLAYAVPRILRARERARRAAGARAAAACRAGRGWGSGGVAGGAAGALAGGAGAGRAGVGAGW